MKTEGHVTLTLPNTNPISLYNAIATLGPAAITNVPRQVSELRVFGDNGLVYYGGADVASTNFGYSIASLADYIEDKTENCNGVSLTTKFIRADAGSTTVVHVNWRVY